MPEFVGRHRGNPFWVAAVREGDAGPRTVGFESRRLLNRDLPRPLAIKSARVSMNVDAVNAEAARASIEAARASINVSWPGLARPPTTSCAAPEEVVAGRAKLNRNEQEHPVHQTPYPDACGTRPGHDISKHPAPHSRCRSDRAFIQHQSFLPPQHISRDTGP